MYGVYNRTQCQALTEIKWGCAKDGARREQGAPNFQLSTFNCFFILTTSLLYRYTILHPTESASSDHSTCLGAKRLATVLHQSSQTPPTSNSINPTICFLLRPSTYSRSVRYRVTLKALPAQYLSHLPSSMPSSEPGLPSQVFGFSAMQSIFVLHHIATEAANSLTCDMGVVVAHTIPCVLCL